MAKGYLNAIVHCYIDGQHVFKRFHKIKDVESRLEKFEHFARDKLRGADYVNYYGNDEPNAFVKRRYLTPK